MTFRYASIVLAVFLSMPCLAQQSAARDVADATISEATTSTGTTIGTADTLKTRTKSNNANERVVSEPMAPVVAVPASTETADSKKRSPAKPIK